MNPWYRIFAATSDMPIPETIREFLANQYGSVSVAFAADDSGWYQADLLVDGISLQLERYLADEPGIRAELNSWAAWLETRASAPEHVFLMERMIQTVQLFTLQCEGESAQAESACVALCRFLAETTGGVYQIDERGFFAADGTLLVVD